MKGKGKPALAKKEKLIQTVVHVGQQPTEDKMKEMGKNARQKILDNYQLKDLLPKHIENLKQLANKI